MPSAVAAGQRAHLKAAHSHHAAGDGEGGALLAVALHLVSVGLVCPRLLAAHHLHRVGRQRRRQRVQQWRGRSGGGGVSPAQRGGQSAKGEGWVGVGQGGVGCRRAGSRGGWRNGWAWGAWRALGPRHQLCRASSRVKASWQGLEGPGSGGRGCERLGPNRVRLLNPRGRGQPMREQGLGLLDTAWQCGGGAAQRCVQVTPGFTGPCCPARVRNRAGLGCQP